MMAAAIQSTMTSFMGDRSAEVDAPRMLSARLEDAGSDDREEAKRRASGVFDRSNPTGPTRSSEAAAGRPSQEFSQAELKTCLDVLDALHRMAPDHPAYLAVERAAAHLTKSAKKKRRLTRKQTKRVRDRELLESAERVAMNRQGRLGSAQQAPPSGPDSPGERELGRRRLCYVCKAAYRRVHAFYHALCPTCAERNFLARSERVDLTGRRALLTGGRMKIGFELALKLLRDGAHVAVTTRFPRDAARRYAECEDFARWRHRLEIHGLDFRFLPRLVTWIEELLARGEPLDILINNAAQTVWRPTAYYAQVLAAERELDLPDGARALIAGGGSPAASAEMLDPRALSRAAEQALFPAGARDEEDRQLDLREQNSWRLSLHGVEPIEAVEVMVVNAIAPFLLSSRLLPLLSCSPRPDRYIVNVSAMEGKFTYKNKTARHPHTNMAKAALNMMTRTAADEYASKGIYMTSVDTGWITQENPQPIKKRLAREGFCPPLDIIDGAARVYAPIVRGVRGDPVYGVFLKDYEPTDW